MIIATFILVISTTTNNREHFKQVAMINNTQPEPEEWPIFYPVPLPPPMVPTMDCCCDEDEQVAPPAPLPSQPTPNVPKPSPTIPSQVPTGTPTTPPSKETPTPTIDAKPPTARSPAPAAPPKEPLVPVITTTPTTPGNPYCISPQYVICEVHPAPKISINAYKLGSVDKATKLQPVQKWEAFEQPDILLQPQYDVEENGFAVSYVKFKNRQSIAFTPTNVSLDVGKNKGISFVYLARLNEGFDPFGSYKLMAVTDKYTLTVDDVKYYVLKDKWSLIIKVYKEEDTTGGTTVSTYINEMDDLEEIHIEQLQTSDKKLEDIVALAPKDVQVMTGAIDSEIDVVYVGVYDRPLTAYERKTLIRTSCEEIINKLSKELPVPKAILDYNIETIIENNITNKIFTDTSDSALHLMYNESTTPNFVLAPPKYLALTKNQRFYSQNSVSLDLSAGYSVELLFCGTEFAFENDAVIFAYTIRKTDILYPDIIAKVSTVDSSTTRGNKFSVTYANSFKRFECQELIEKDMWYHIVFTSESTIYFNGQKVVPKGRAVANIPTMEGQDRYVSIGDNTSATAMVVTNDVGHTMVGRYALIRVYNAPINSDTITLSYNTVKGTMNPYKLP
jgi:hypothetical protein